MRHSLLSLKLFNLVNFILGSVVAARLSDAAASDKNLSISAAGLHIHKSYH
jgi:hypothetical protein